MAVKQPNESIDLTVYIEVSTNIARLFWIHLIFLAVEVMPNSGITNYVATHILVTRFFFFLIHSLYLFTALDTVLRISSVSGRCIVEILASLVIPPLVCVSCAFMISTITGLLDGVSWILTISIIAKKKWNDIVDR